MDRDGEPTETLKSLFKELEFSEPHTLEEMNAIAQKNFLRAPHEERWEIKERFGHKKEFLLPLLNDLGLLRTHHPSFKVPYDYILIHGGVIFRIRARLKFLNDLWPSFSPERREHLKIIFLTGPRLLSPLVESPKMFFEEKNSDIPFRAGWEPPSVYPKTEDEAAFFLWDQMIEHEDLRQKKDSLSMIFTYALGQNKARPTTRDTLKHMIDSSSHDFKNLPPAYASFWQTREKPLEDFNYLAISNNPYIFYQDLIVRNTFQQMGLLFKKGSLETVGPEVPSHTTMSEHLDNIARCISEEIVRRSFT